MAIKIFEKSYSIAETFTTKIEIDTEQFPNWDEDTLLEYVDDLLWDQATTESSQELSDDLMPYPVEVEEDEE